MHVPWLIEKKRDGYELSDGEIRYLIEGFSDGAIPDYQMSALLMAILLRGMNFDEISSLTDSMMQSGKLLDLSSILVPTVDKHSTGGIGDKVSLILAPLLASLDCAVPMLSGRGLGITGGTLDKLEAIPGFRTNLSEAEFLKTIKDVGCSIIGQTKDICPADKKLYALRDVTGTVPSIPLISASIMSKKLAEGVENLVLDVKFGCGAFMKTKENAKELARTMREIGRRFGRNVEALITPMDEPLGRSIGNALEVEESIRILKGGDLDLDLSLLTIELAALLLKTASLSKNMEEARKLCEAKLRSGEAFQAFERMIKVQGGDLELLKNCYKDINVYQLEAKSSGYVQSVNAELIGKAVLLLGGGRKLATDAVTPGVGISALNKRGTSIHIGEPLCKIHHNSEPSLKDALDLLGEAFLIGDDKPDTHLELELL